MQEEAVNFSGKNLLVLAGAGTGKTHTIIARVDRLIKLGVEPERIALLTFTRRSAFEMIERIKNLREDNKKNVFAGTFHNMCLRLMRTYPNRFPLGKFIVISAEDQEQLMKIAVEIVSEDNPDLVLPKANEILNYFSYARNTYNSINVYLDKFVEGNKKKKDAIIECIKKYVELKKNSNYIDFDDLLFMFLKCLQSDEETRNLIKSKFDHLLVDETQDTNPLQWEILKLMADPAKLFCVGDDAQSIYAFRGADFRNVHEFSNRIPDSSIIKLDENYRSTQPILDLSNLVLKRSKLNYNKDLKSTRGDGVKPVVKDFYSKQEEAEWIVNNIKKQFSRIGKWKEIMVLTRTAFAARDIELKLIEAEIPYRFYGGTSIIKSLHINNILATCKAALFPHDQLSWMRYLKLWPGIGAKTASKFCEEVMDMQNIEQIVAESKAKLRNKETLFKVLLEIFNSKANLSNVIHYTWEQIKTLFNESEESIKRRGRDVEVFASLADNFKSLEEMLDIFTIDPVHNSVIDNVEVTDFVSLMTIHSAKGTESQVCYLAQSQVGMFPHSRSLGNFESEEEERRILYVALTRAKDDLFITRSSDAIRNIFYSGSKTKFATEKGNAYFLEKLDKYVQTDNLTGDYRKVIWNKELTADDLYNF